MEQMPFHSHQDAGQKIFPSAAAYAAVPKDLTTTSTDWKASLPVLHGQCVTLRALTLSDAPSLLALLTTEEVSRFISPPPTTLEGFEKFIEWTHRQRAAGQYACFAVVPEGTDVAVGIFQVRSLEANFTTAEWGFVIGSAYWGRGLFAEGAPMVLAFAFETLGVHRLEARASVENGRGNGALRKAGATLEGTLRQSFLKDGRYHNQHLWTILDADWRAEARRPEFRLASFSSTSSPAAPEVAPTIH